MNTNRCRGNTINLSRSRAGLQAGSAASAWTGRAELKGSGHFLPDHDCPLLPLLPWLVCACRTASRNKPGISSGSVTNANAGNPRQPPIVVTSLVTSSTGPG